MRHPSLEGLPGALRLLVPELDELDWPSEARATCDTDGDGVPAVFVSSNKEKPKQLTGDEVR